AADDERHDRQAAHDPDQERDEAVAAPVDHGRADDRPGEGARVHGLFGRPLGLVVARAGAFARAERAHMDVAADADGRRRGDHVARTLHVHAIERRVRRDVLADDADEVDHRVAAGHALLERLRRQHVSLDALLLLLLLWPTLAAAQAPDFTGVDEAANALVTSGEIPGVVVLIGRGDEVLLHRAYGSRRLVPEPAPMMLTTIFDIASLTKPF